jgi:hypothetical protein
VSRNVSTEDVLRYGGLKLGLQRFDSNIKATTTFLPVYAIRIEERQVVWSSTRKDARECDHA